MPDPNTIIDPLGVLHSRSDAPQRPEGRFAVAVVDDRIELSFNSIFSPTLRIYLNRRAAVSLADQLRNAAGAH